MCVRQVHVCSGGGGGEDSRGERARECCPDERLLPDTCKIDFFKLNLGCTVCNISIYIKHQYISINASTIFSN